MDDNDQRVLAKQWFFFKYEKELKQIAKQEKLARIQAKKEAKALNGNVSPVAAKAQKNHK